MNPNKWNEFFQKTLDLGEIQMIGAAEPVILPRHLLRLAVDYRPDPILRTSLKEALATSEASIRSSKSPLPKEIKAPASWDAEQVNLYINYLYTVATAYLAFAVIEDDRATVKAILDDHPELLIFTPHPFKLTSELTGQTFEVNTILGIACRRKQIEMVKILLPYFNQLTKTDDDDDDQIQKSESIRNVGLAEWLKYQVDAEKNIQVPEDYQALINGLIDVFKAETIAPNTPVKTLSDTVETAMNVLYERLLPGVTNEEMTQTMRPVFTKENHIDVELLLYAAYKAYAERFDEFQTWEQREAYCIRVIGIVQNFLPPETGKIFCEGLYYVVEEGRKISDRAEDLRLADDKTRFYGSLDLVHPRGGGFDYFVGSAGRGGGAL